MRALATLLLVALSALTLAGCVSPPAPAPASVATPDALPMLVADPLAAGEHAFDVYDYDGGTVSVGGKDADHGDYEYDARIRGRLWIPQGPGPWPIAVFLHGQHQTCQFQGNEALLSIDDCSDEAGLNTPYPSHLGYAYLAEHLASHGIAVASILNYEVNARNGNPDVGMWARGELVLATLDALRDLPAGMPQEAAGRLDLSRVGLMGHSRGGEGVVTAVHVNLAREAAQRHALLAVVALAPTDFNFLGVAGVPLLSITPLCDGDVFSLHGLRTYDHSRWLDAQTPKVQLLVRGANHNHYNTRWGSAGATPLVADGDDAPPGRHTGTFCSLPREYGGGRLTPAETLTESTLHIGGFLRWHLGGETGLAPYFTGEVPMPSDACPRGACEDFVFASAIVAGTRPLLVIEEGDVPTTNAVGGALRLDGFSRISQCASSDCDGNVYSSADVLDLSWESGASLTLDIPAAAGDWRAFDAFTFRAAVPTYGDANDGPVDLAFVLRTASGSEVRVSHDFGAVLDLPPDHQASSPVTNVGSSKVTLNEVRLPLAAFGEDLGAVASVTLEFQDAGRVLLTDFALAPATYASP